MVILNMCTMIAPDAYDSSIIELEMLVAPPPISKKPSESVDLWMTYPLFITMRSFPREFRVPFIVL